VLPVKSGLGGGDITKRGGRWESDFIWNKDWAKQLDYEESLRKQQAEGADKSEAATGKGFLSLGGAKVDLNSMDVDLSEQLRARKKSGSQASASGGAAPAQRSPRRRPKPAAKFAAQPPTRVEQRAWARGGKYGVKVVAISPSNDVDQDALAAKVAAEKARYDELKAELQAWAAGLTVVSLTATYAFYGRWVVHGSGCALAQGVSQEQAEATVAGCISALDRPNPCALFFPDLNSLPRLLCCPAPPLHPSRAPAGRWRPATRWAHWRG
jgi:hypothetical protein